MMVNSIDKVKKEKIVRQFGNEFFTRVEADHDNMVLIEGAIESGRTLKSEENLDVRLDVFCNLFKELHKKDKSLEKTNYTDNTEFKYKSYKDWVFKISDYMDKQASWKEVALHMRRAKDLYIELSKRSLI